jgi:hypothetical protein
MGKFKRVPADVPVSDLSPLNISCGSTKCDSGLHCFTVHQDAAKKKFGVTSVCYECGRKLDSWDRLHLNNIKDSKFVFKELQNELIRHVYWHMPINKVDKEKALKKGLVKIKDEIIKRITTEIGVAKPFRGGYTPYYGNIIYYGQHATASCCRQCIEHWHGIPVGRAMTKDEIEYLSSLVLEYIEERVPELKQ